MRGAVTGIGIGRIAPAPGFRQCRTTWVLATQQGAGMRLSRSRTGLKSPGPAPGRVHWHWLANAVLVINDDSREKPSGLNSLLEDLNRRRGCTRRVTARRCMNGDILLTVTRHAGLRGLEPGATMNPAALRQTSRSIRWLSASVKQEQDQSSLSVPTARVMARHHWPDSNRRNT